MSRFRILVLGTLVALVSCTHPVNIQGRGDIVSESGERDCAGDEAPCDFLITGAYQETYQAVPDPGWRFLFWQGCIELAGLTAIDGDKCIYTMPANAVSANNGRTMPELEAVFVRDSLEVTGPATPLEGSWRNPCIDYVPEGEDPQDYTSSTETYTFTGNVASVVIENFDGPGCQTPFEPRSNFSTQAYFRIADTNGTLRLVEVDESRTRKLYTWTEIRGDALYFSKKTGDDDWQSDPSRLDGTVDLNEPYFSE